MWTVVFVTTSLAIFGAVFLTVVVGARHNGEVDPAVCASCGAGPGQDCDTRREHR